MAAPKENMNAYVFVCMGRVFFIPTPLSDSIYKPHYKFQGISDAKSLLQVVKSIYQPSSMKYEEEKDISAKQKPGAEVFIRVNYGILIKKI